MWSIPGSEVFIVLGFAKNFCVSSFINIKYLKEQTNFFEMKVGNLVRDTYNKSHGVRFLFDSSRSERE